MSHHNESNGNPGNSSGEYSFIEGTRRPGVCISKTLMLRAQAERISRAFTL
jgi:hypothetical protein